MATAPHATTDEQTAALGNIKRKPMQIDMFTGELVKGKPKSGNGSHIALKSLGTERAAVAGMASWAGGGPAGKYCEDCSFYGSVAVQRPNSLVDRSLAACLRAAQRLGRVSPGRIATCSACDQFSAEKSPKAWLIDWAGVTHAPDWIDARGVGRFHKLNEIEDPERPGHLRSAR